MTGLAEMNKHSDEGIHCHQSLQQGKRRGHLEIGWHLPDFLKKNGGSCLLRRLEERRERSEEVVELGYGLPDQLCRVSNALREESCERGDSNFRQWSNAHGSRLFNIYELIYLPFSSFFG